MTGVFHVAMDVKVGQHQNRLIDDRAPVVGLQRACLGPLFGVRDGKGLSEWPECRAQCGNIDCDLTVDCVVVIGAAAQNHRITAMPDPAAGVNVFVTTTEFRVAPESASSDHVDGEGHFHLYVDGEKRLRFYNEAIHVEGIPEGPVEIAVELSTNDHGAYADGGEPIVATTSITVPPHDHGTHDHGEPEPAELAGDTPELSISVLPDASSGWNAFIDLEGFVLSGEHASADHVEGEGHIHLYIDDLKVMRLYGRAAHLATIPAGEHVVRVHVEGGDFSESLRIRGTFQSGGRRRLVAKVGGLLSKKLSLVWGATSRE